MLKRGAPAVAAPSSPARRYESGLRVRGRGTGVGGGGDGRLEGHVRVQRRGRGGLLLLLLLERLAVKGTVLKQEKGKA